MNQYFAEFLATAVLLLLGNGSVANVTLKKTKGNGSDLMIITTAWALAVFVAVTIAGPYSGAHLNPAVTLGLAAAGRFPWHDVLPYIGAQMAGGFLGATIVWLFYKKHIDITEDKDTLLGIFCTSPAIKSNCSNFISEFVATCVLILGVLFISSGEISVSGASIPDGQGVLPVGLGSVGAIPIAFFIWVIGNSLGGTTGYAINPARDLAPRIAHAILPMKHKGGSDWGYSWIPVVAPICAGLIIGWIYYHYFGILS